MADGGVVFDGRLWCLCGVLRCGRNPPLSYGTLKFFAFALLVCEFEVICCALCKNRKYQYQIPISIEICSKHHKYQHFHPNHAKFTESTHIRLHCRTRLHEHNSCTCAMPKITPIRFVEHNKSSIFLRGMFK